MSASQVTIYLFLICYKIKLVSIDYFKHPVSRHVIPSKISDITRVSSCNILIYCNPSCRQEKRKCSSLLACRIFTFSSFVVYYFLRTTWSVSWILIKVFSPVTASSNIVLCLAELFWGTNRTTKNRCHAKNLNSLYLSNKLLSLEILLMIIFKKEYILLRNVILHIVKVTRNISLLLEKKIQFLMLWSECKFSS